MKDWVPCELYCFQLTFVRQPSPLCNCSYGLDTEKCFTDGGKKLKKKIYEKLLVFSSVFITSTRTCIQYCF